MTDLKIASDNVLDKRNVAQACFASFLNNPNDKIAKSALAAALRSYSIAHANRQRIKEITQKNITTDEAKSVKEVFGLASKN